MNRISIPMSLGRPITCFAVFARSSRKTRQSPHAKMTVEISPAFPFSLRTSQSHPTFFSSIQRRSRTDGRAARIGQKALQLRGLSYMTSEQERRRGVMKYRAIHPVSRKVLKMMFSEIPPADWLILPRQALTTDAEKHNKTLRPTGRIAL